MKGKAMGIRPIKDQKGFAALVVSVTLVIILGLLTVGFAQLSRNELAQTTNRQLSSQAYYAAESGINDAVRAIADGYNQKKTDCGPVTSPTGPGEKDLTDNTVSTSGGNAVQWTCLLINPAPKSLQFGSVSTTVPRTFKTWSEQNITSITFYWQDAAKGVTGFQNNTGAGSNSAFPPLTNPSGPSWQSGIHAGGSGSTGLLRVAVTPITDTSRQGLINSTFTAFMYPSYSSSTGLFGSTSYAPSQNTTGTTVDGKCNVGNTPKYCAAKITFSSTIPAGTPILLDLRSIYSATDVQIRANDGAADLLGVQTDVDSTGRDQDVLKRIQVAVPNNNEYTYPGFTLDSLDGICKLLDVYPGSASGCSY